MSSLTQRKMNWLPSIFVGVPTGILGLFCIGFLANACANWYRVSSFEGKAGYFVVMLALLGGVLGFIIGLVTGLNASGGYFKSLGLACAITIGLSGIATLFCRTFADVPPKIDGNELMLEVELRLPVGETLVADTNSESYVDLGSVINRRRRNHHRGQLKITDAKVVDGRWVIPGEVYIYTRRGHRMLTSQINGQFRDGFMVPLPARPGKEFEQWSGWLPRSITKDQPWPDSKMSYRFRVQQMLPPPPEPGPREVEAKEFAALKPDAPLEAWLSRMKHDSPDERVQAVMSVVEARQPELATLIRSTNESPRELALSAVPKLTTITPEVSEAVLAEGREIADAIRRFNEMKPEEPRYYDIQVQLRSRFNYWKRAWWTTHQRLGLDGRPPVQEIYDLAEIRAKGTSMNEIVLNARVILEALKPAPAANP